MSICVVIGCAGTKDPAKLTFTRSGVSVKFLSDPALVAPTSSACQHPDDLIGSGSRTWRDELVALNSGKSLSPGIGLTGRDLIPAVDLYQPVSFSAIYRKLYDWTKANGHDFAILSAGWGWVGPNFKLPDYDITFTSVTKGTSKYRHGGMSAPHKFSPGRFRDFAPWLAPATPPIGYVPEVAHGVSKIVLLAGQDYVNLFCLLTKYCPVSIAREIFVHGGGKRLCPGAVKRSYSDGANRTWMYQAAADIIAGKIRL